MALSADAGYIRNGSAPTANQFAAAPTSGAVIYRNALLAYTAAGTVQPIQEGGSIVFAGLAGQAVNTSGQPLVPDYVPLLKGTYGIVVPGATFANLYEPVYATDDATLTLTAGSNIQVGTLVGIDPLTGLTYVNLLGS